MNAPQRETLTFDQVHLGVPDPLAAAEWYRRNLGATLGDHDDRVMFGSVRLIFLKNADPIPTQDSAIERVGLSFADIGPRLRALEDAGIRVLQPTNQTNGMYKAALVEDPWGARIEILEDRETVGFHHVQLRVPNPDEARRWYVDMFGGDPARLKGKRAGVKYGDVWIFAESGKAEPSATHAIDHIGWRMPDLLTTAARLKVKQLKFTTEPHPGPAAAHSPVMMSFAEDPWGVKIELLQRKPDSRQ